MTELRVYLPLHDLQPQFAAYLATARRTQGYPVFTKEHSLLIEVAPALSIHRIVDLALKAVEDMEPGIVYTERNFGLLELHSERLEDVETAGRAVLKGIGAKPEDRLAPSILFHDIIEDVADRHSTILNRSREASMIVPGQSLLVYEMTPALFACAAANEAERAVPTLTIVDVQMIGASGRVFLAGESEALHQARERITETLESIKGRAK